MNISGKINLFVEDKTTSEGRAFKVFNATLSHKNEDGSYINASIPVVFGKENFSEEKKSALKSGVAYLLNVTKGFLDVKAYTDKNGDNKRQILLFVQEAKIESAKKVANKNLENSIDAWK